MTGHDEDWLPDVKVDFDSTDAAAGSPEKIEILRKRLELGLPLWHNDDRYDYNGLTGAIRPRESMYIGGFKRRSMKGRCQKAASFFIGRRDQVA